jgi:hypothetical protein
VRFVGDVVSVVVEASVPAAAPVTVSVAAGVYDVRGLAAAASTARQLLQAHDGGQEERHFGYDQRGSRHEGDLPHEHLRQHARHAPHGQHHHAPLPLVLLASA